MNKNLKILFYGFLSWFIPFISSFFFYSRTGELQIDIFLFKSIMIVVGSITGAVLLVLYFRALEKNYLREGITVGGSWFAINIILDLVVLIPMSGMPLGDYFAGIGLRYLVIPVMSIAMGYIADSV